MDFFDYLLPEQYSFGAKGGPMFSTEVVKTTGGQVYANRNWLYPLHAFDVSAVIRVQADFDFFRNLFYNVAGQVSAFRFRHRDDYQVDGTNSSLTLISGSVWQLNKLYVSGTRTFVRPVYALVSGVVITRTRSGVQSTPTATVDLLTGQATIAGHVTGDTYTWVGQFHVWVAFTTDKMEAVISNKTGSGKLLIEWPNIVLEERRR